VNHRSAEATNTNTILRPQEEALFRGLEWEPSDSIDKLKRMIWGGQALRISMIDSQHLFPRFATPRKLWTTISSRRRTAAYRATTGVYDCTRRVRKAFQRLGECAGSNSTQDKTRDWAARRSEFLSLLLVLVLPDHTRFLISKTCFGRC